MSTPSWSDKNGIIYTRETRFLTAQDWWTPLESKMEELLQMSCVEYRKRGAYCD